MKMTFARNTRIVLLLVCIFQITAVGYEADINDFATEVVDYNAGSGTAGYNNPTTALGRPSIDTLFWGVARPVLPVFSAWGTNQIVTVGTGGSLTLKFNHKVGDDENNHYGLDFIIFGNQMQGIGGWWNYGDPCAFTFNSEQVASEFGKVWVSQDGNNWYCFDDGPYADSFAPTLGRVYDTTNPYDGYEGWENLWWGEVTNPTLPLDPNLKPNDFAGNTVAYVCQAYGESAGGTAFDLRWLSPEDYDALEVDLQTGCKWIQYVKIEPGGTEKPEIDAISDVAACGDYKHPFPIGDLNADCKVNFEDVMLLCDYWLAEINEPNDPAEIADIYQDDIVNFYDLALMAENWLQCNWDCE
ncbi:MAG: hypothetical protein JW947_02485 [Sedimentisphaerales bacterium]|nr:hypothetical protein [Sedimentisphaerales bacterium]